jgi:hypothetical protein
MENMQEKYIETWIEDGILYITLNFENYTEQMVEAGIKQRLELTKDKSYPILADIRNIKNFSREARQRLAQKDAAFGTKAVALLSNSKVQEVLYNFFNTIYKAPAPTKTFTNKEKAIEWLKQFK